MAAGPRRCRRSSSRAAGPHSRRGSFRPAGSDLTCWTGADISRGPPVTVSPGGEPEPRRYPATIGIAPLDLIEEHARPGPSHDGAGSAGPAVAPVGGRRIG
jgi:hypothetical protein